MKKLILLMLLMVTTPIFSQIGVKDLLNKNNVSNILKEGYVRNGNTFTKSNRDKIIFNDGENIWFGNDKKTFDNLKSSIDKSYRVMNIGTYATHRSKQYQKDGVIYIFTEYYYGSQYKYMVNVATGFGKCDM